MTDSATILVRQLHSTAELDAAVELQRAVWHCTDLEIEPRSILTVAARFSGQMLGAFDGGELVGFASAFASYPFGHLHSHRVGVLPAYQNRGVGRLLKLAQRDDALLHGVPAIQWSFDPLQTRNAHFNLNSLGGIARTYLHNLYGETSSPLHGGLPTDRILLEWHLDSPRVQRALAGEPLPSAAGAMEIELPASDDRRDRDAQIELADALGNAFAAGLAVTGFRESQGRAVYLLESL
jgi:predicted GNAT superfamily acetyltransferase